VALARELVELGSRLRGDAAIDLFAARGRGSFLSAPETAPFLQRLEGVSPSGALVLCLQALQVQLFELAPKLLDAELVATLPPEVPGLARPTETVIQEMIARARSEIILLGYDFTDAGLVQQLATACNRTVSVVLICDRHKGGACRVSALWPNGGGKPRIFHDRQRPGAAPFASLHAKCILVDAAELLVTSANFTFHGLRGNIEVGIRIAGSPAAEARKVFSYLVETQIVEPFDGVRIEPADPSVI
jgi:phosphatidylserine/phosphatidylglycerophosphate/cardiolipin synthase-like enzyme